MQLVNWEGTFILQAAVSPHDTSQPAQGPFRQPSPAGSSRCCAADLPALQHGRWDYLLFFLHSPDILRHGPTTITERPE